MKSLILKDLYNIGHNLKSMLFILIVFAFAVIPFSGISSYIFICAILCSMMIVTTFTFDDSSHWLRYALILPITKKDIVLAKFVTLFIFSSLGSLFGLILGLVGGIIINDVGFNSYDILELLFIALVALVIAMIFGGMSIPLVLKFGAEKGRLLLMVSFLFPAPFLGNISITNVTWCQINSRCTFCISLLLSHYCINMGLYNV